MHANKLVVREIIDKLGVDKIFFVVIIKSYCKCELQQKASHIDLIKNADKKYYELWNT